MGFIINPFFNAAAPPIVGAFRWYDAAFYSLPDGTAIAVATPWDDQSANDSDATTVLTQEPSFRTNIFGTLPAIRFSYPDRFLFDSGVFVLTNFTIICIAKTTSDSIWMSDSSTNRQVRIARAGVNNYSYYDGGGEVISGTLTQPLADAKMNVWRRNAGTTTVDFFENAVNFAGAATVGTASFDTIGAQAVAGAIDMDIGEIVIFDTYKTDLEVQDLYNNYFKPKFGLP